MDSIGAISKSLKTSASISTILGREPSAISKLVGAFEGSSTSKSILAIERHALSSKIGSVIEGFQRSHAATNEHISRLCGSINFAEQLGVGAPSNIADSFGRASSLFEAHYSIPEVSRISDLVGNMSAISSATNSILDSVGGLNARELWPGIDMEATTSITQGFLEMATGYDAAIGRLDGLLPTMDVIPVKAYLPVELYREAAVQQAFSPSAIANIDDAEVEAAIVEALPSIDHAIEAHDERLLVLLQGARAAIRRRDPDYQRHVTVSLRELVNHAVESLSPDDEFKLWTSDEDLYYNGRPSRRGRLLYICRHCNSAPLATFIECDLKASMEFIRVLNSGTHKIDSRLSDHQLEIIIKRAESLIGFLLKVATPPEG